MTGRHRIIVLALLAAGLAAGAALYLFATVACPSDTPSQPCPEAGRNLAIGVALAGVTVALIVTAFALLGEVVARRRIVYRGAWSRAARRGVLAGLVVCALGGLRLGGTLSVPVAAFVLILAGALEWLVVQRERRT